MIVLRLRLGDLRVKRKPTWSRTCSIAHELTTPRSFVSRTERPPRITLFEAASTSEMPDADEISPWLSFQGHAWAS